MWMPNQFWFEPPHTGWGQSRAFWLSAAGLDEDAVLSILARFDFEPPALGHIKSYPVKVGHKKNPPKPKPRHKAPAPKPVREPAPPAKPNPIDTLLDELSQPPALTVAQQKLLDALPKGEPFRPATLPASIRKRWDVHRNPLLDAGKIETLPRPKGQQHQEYVTC